MAREKPKWAQDCPLRVGSMYPKSLAGVVASREKNILGDIFGLTQFGVNQVRLKPGAASAHRHWHAREDEFVYVLAGELTLVMDAGETLLTPGMVVGFPAGERDGHHLVNKSESDGVYLEIGTRSAEEVVDYPDVDLQAEKSDGCFIFRHKDGRPYDPDTD
ncbi:MAG: cupin domain-containing protein [Magnetospiraceae bacterium]